MKYILRSYWLILLLATSSPFSNAIPLWSALGWLGLSAVGRNNQLALRRIYSNFLLFESQIRRI